MIPSLSAPRLSAPLPPVSRLLTRAERGRRRPKPKRKGKPTTRQDKGKEYFIESDAKYRDLIRSRLDLRRMQVGAPREPGEVGVSHLWSDYRVAWEKATILYKEDLLYALPPLCFFPPSLPVFRTRREKFNTRRSQVPCKKSAWGLRGVLPCSLDFETTALHRGIYRLSPRENPSPIAQRGWCRGHVPPRKNRTCGNRWRSTP